MLLPIWVPAFWSNCHIEYAPAQQRWAVAVEWLKRPELRPFEHIVKSVFQGLASLPWSAGNLSYESALGPIPFSTDLLAIFLSNNWLADEHVDLLISFLSEKLASDTALASSTLPTLLLNTCHIHLIEKACLAGTIEGSNKTVLDRLGRTLQSASQVGGVFHVNGNHWVAMVIIPGEARVLYGDPAGSPPNRKTAASIVWFCQQFIPSTSAIDSFTFDILPSPRQDFSTDWWNCGILSFNALDHYLFPIDTQLFEHTEKPGFGDAARLSILNELLIHRSEKVGFVNTNDQASSVQRRDLARFLSTSSTKAGWGIKWTEDADVKSAKLKKGKKGSKKVKTTDVADPSESKVNTSTAGKQSFLAPIFNVPALPLPPTDTSKRKLEDEDSSRDLPPSKKQYASLTHLTPLNDNSDATDSEPDNPQQVRGRPADEVMDILTVLVNAKTRPKLYQCVGKGCTKMWKPRASSRVFPHSKSCCFLTAEQRKLAAQHSASSAPSALVAADEASASKVQQPEPLTTSSSNSSVSSTTSTLTSDTFFGTGGRKQIHNQLDFAILRLVCAAGLSGNLVDRQEWKAIFTIATPTYSPASRSKLMDSQIQSEHSRVKELQYELLRKEKNISISYDGGSLKGGQSVYTIHATLPDGRVFFLHGENGQGVSHTGVWLAGVVLGVIDNFGGRETVTSFSADGTGNTRVSRAKLVEAVPAAFDLPDPPHFMNRTWGEIGGLEYFSEVVKVVRGTIKHFKHSNFGQEKLRELRPKFNINRGLESAVKTRFATMVWSALSLQRNLPAIRELVSTGVVEIPNFNTYFMKDTPLTFQLEIWLTQFIAVGECFARAIICIEGTNTNPADVYFYWVAIISRLKHNLETCQLPDSVCQEIRRIVNRRWEQFFVRGPTNVHLTAFYLHPDYVRLAVLRNPNRLAFTLRLPASENPKNHVPPGIPSPNVFKEVGKYLYYLLVNEITHGSNSFLQQFTSKPAALTKMFKTQFTAWAQGTYPFSIGLGPGQSPRDYWRTYEGTADGGVLAAIAIKLFSAVPHSMADERTMSYITLLNTALRSRQKVETVVAMATVRSYYQTVDAQKKRRGRSKTTGEALRFFDTERLTREIEDSTRHEDPDYEPSDDEEEEEDNAEPAPTQDNGGSPIGTVLPGKEPSSELDLTTRVVRELLADAPMPLVTPAYLRPKVSIPEIEIEEAGGSFELGEWV
ncbi:hypothetical protein FA13DRAFT_1799116 [Coprinellus micaceus]|uniref:Ubiquitin-like protease family profile domain-containing protein n=1 Tax=Coprinellus micaceus TaxID=71717 RepID=A0A4Y7SKG0_COPMI|nr:hypothetical protein FA13DRAFT_1799116 [Coprinellus micaceus]